jgi:transcriptional regulator with XRE-family HTH domain
MDAEVNTINLLIALKRKSKKYSFEDMLEKLGWESPAYNDMSYGDIEFYADELESVLDFKDVKKLFNVLSIDWNEALGLMIGKSNYALEEKMDERAINEIIKLQKEKLGLSDEKLADEVDVEIESIAEIQTSSSSFEKWCLEDILRLVEVLKLNPFSFIRKLL